MSWPERPKPGELSVSNHASGKRQRLCGKPLFDSRKGYQHDYHNQSEARHHVTVVAARS
jgi:hypothetical protein